MSMKTYRYKKRFQLESGKSLPDLILKYHTYGKLNEHKNNVVWVFHALSSNSNVLDWWGGLFGENNLFSPNKYFIICCSTIGSPYGSLQPKNLNFPTFTVRDVANAHLLLAHELGINQLHTAIGGSFGGSQALEFAYAYPHNIDHLILIASGAKESAWGIAIHEAQRLALAADPTFGKETGGSKGLLAARAIGMLTYRTPRAYNQQQTNEESDFILDDFKAASYIRYQSEKFEKRFNALSYYYLTKCMDSHHIGRGRGGLNTALHKITAKTLAIGINTDQLLPPEMQKLLVAQMPNACFSLIESTYGHDGFLIETEQLSNRINHFLNKK